MTVRFFVLYEGMGYEQGAGIIHVRVIHLFLRRARQLAIYLLMNRSETERYV